MYSDVKSNNLPDARAIKWRAQDKKNMSKLPLDMHIGLLLKHILSVLITWPSYRLIMRWNSIHHLWGMAGIFQMDCVYLWETLTHLCQLSSVYHAWQQRYQTVQVKVKDSPILIPVIQKYKVLADRSSLWTDKEPYKNKYSLYVVQGICWYLGSCLQTLLIYVAHFFGDHRGILT